MLSWTTSPASSSRPSSTLSSEERASCCWVPASPDPRQIRYWRDSNGPEVDWVIEGDGRLWPVEVKWTDMPRDRDIRHLKRFLATYPQAEQGHLVCRVPRRTQLDARIFAVPWQACDELVL
ncbi:MAG: DUF4143 domain-containing protein [Deltaproteobacteria bacterium]|nr:DUF4143 domain-containing protein [Deltaproteobacteria bacterium]